MSYPRAVDTFCTFLTLPNSRLSLRREGQEASPSGVDTKVEHTYALTVRPLIVHVDPLIVH
eukprot:948409-Prorocentrum_minimum.AAC.1